MPYAAEEQAASHQAQQPTLYLHGSVDGCIGVELVQGAERHLAPGSRMLVVEGAGHFLHLERPEEVNEHILAWASGYQDRSGMSSVPPSAPTEKSRERATSAAATSWKMAMTVASHPGGPR